MGSKNPQNGQRSLEFLPKLRNFTQSKSCPNLWIHQLQQNKFLFVGPRQVEFEESSTKSPKKSAKDRRKKIDILPLDHPLRSVLPDRARVVGIQSESGLFHPHIMTLAEFLEASRDMEKIHAIRSHFKYIVRPDNYFATF